MEAREVIYTSRPDQEPARHAWRALSHFGQPLELEFVPAGVRGPDAYWRFRFVDEKTKKERSGFFRQDSVASVSDDKLDRLEQLESTVTKGQEMLGRIKQVHEDVSKGKVSVASGRRVSRRIEHMASEFAAEVDKIRSRSPKRCAPKRSQQ